MIYTPQQLKTALMQKNIQGLALDIDETLADTASHWMSYFLKEYGNPENFTPKEMYEKYRYADSVPYWKDRPGFQELATKIAQSDEVHEALQPIKNANHTIEKINKVIPVVAYVTARTQSTMNGTKNWLKRYSFPDVPLVIRPEKSNVIHRNTWKAKVLEELYPQVQGIVDDNAGLLKELSPQYQGTIYLYDHKHVPETAPATLKVFACRDWQHVYETIQSHLPK